VTRIYETLVFAGLGGLMLSCGPRRVVTRSLPACLVEVPRPDSLRAIAAEAGMVLGVAVTEAPDRRGWAYDRVLRREFGGITPEWQLKWAPLQPEPGVWDFRRSDPLLHCAEARGQRRKGHALLWYRELPDWLPEGAGAMRDAALTHVRTTVTRHAGRVAVWDVVNEAVGDDGGLRDDPLSRVLGPSWVADAFIEAHAADPAARLHYNDYELARIGPRADGVHALLSDLLAADVPVHGVGLQFHQDATMPMGPGELSHQLDRFAALGLETELSEVDIKVGGLAGSRVDKAHAQAVLAQESVATCAAHPSCGAVTFWGLSDAMSWLTREGEAEAPLLYDRRYRPKPARDAVAAGLRGERAQVCETVAVAEAGLTGMTGGSLAEVDGGWRSSTRTELWHGPALDLRERVEVGGTYRVSGKVRVHGEDTLSSRVQLTLRVRTDGELASHRLAMIEVAGEEWGMVDAVLALPADPEDSEVFEIYLEGPDPALDLEVVDWEVAAYCR